MSNLPFKAEFIVNVVFKHPPGRQPCEVCESTTSEPCYLTQIYPLTVEFPDGWGGLEHWYCHNCLHNTVVPKATSVALTPFNI